MKTTSILTFCAITVVLGLMLWDQWPIRLPHKWFAFIGLVVLLYGQWAVVSL